MAHREGPGHPTTMLADRYGDEYEIDVEIAPLIKLLWERELETFNSCQDFRGSGWTWVEFDGPSATDFINEVAKNSEELAGRIDVDFDDEDSWRYRAFPYRWPDGQIQFFVSVHFPRADLSAVVAALEAAA